MLFGAKFLGISGPVRFTADSGPKVRAFVSARVGHVFFARAKDEKQRSVTHCLRKDEMRNSQILSHEAHVTTIRHHV